MQTLLKSDLISFLVSDDPARFKRMVVLTLIVGVVNTLLIGVINLAAKSVSKDESVTLEFFGYAIMLTLFLIFTTKSSQENIKSANDFIYRFKIRIMSDVFESNLLKVDKVGRDYILEVLSRDTELVSHSVNALLIVLQSLSTVFFLTIYMATISLAACLIVFFSGLIALVVGILELVKLTESLQSIAIRESQVNGLFGSFLSGYKEVKMNSARALEITREMIADAKQASAEKKNLLVTITQFTSYLQMTLYLVVGLMIFIVPLLSNDFSTHVMMAATTSLFWTTSMSTVLTSVPNLLMANTAAGSLRKLGETLSQEARQRVAPGMTEFPDVRSIALQDVTYSHGVQGAQAPFVLGPITYEFEVGKVYFIRGNNGSGKTTLMRVLLGLYQSATGCLLVNGQPIAEPANAAYRDLFSVVFSDFYLFKRFYGLPDPQPDEIADLLKLFRMENKVSIEEGGFSELNFSTGQRKRLALLVALLEKKQFIVLDEWAADQDPEFRQEFYEKIIPKLREIGKTVIAITHDDQYYELADHVIYMDNGKPTTHKP